MPIGSYVVKNYNFHGACLKDFDQRIFVVIAARSSESTISECIMSIQEAANHASQRVTIELICDHSFDATSRLGSALGANVIIRKNGMPGKTHCLSEYFDKKRLDVLPSDLFVVTDSTTIWHVTALKSLLRSREYGSEVIVGRAIAQKSANAYFLVGTAVALQSRHLQNLARRRIGLNPLIEGRIMAYSGAFISKYGWSLAVSSELATKGHPTEDWRHGLWIGVNNEKAIYSPMAVVFTPLRRTEQEASQQIRRWDHGRRGVRLDVWKLLKSGKLFRGGARNWIAVSDALAPPQVELLILNLLTAPFAIVSSKPGFVAWATLNIFVLIAYWHFVLQSFVKESNTKISLAKFFNYAVWRIRNYLS